MNSLALLGKRVRSIHYTVFNGKRIESCGRKASDPIPATVTAGRVAGLHLVSSHDQVSIQPDALPILAFDKGKRIMSLLQPHRFQAKHVFLSSISSALLIAAPLSVHAQTESQVNSEVGNNKTLQFEITRNSKHLTFARVEIGKFKSFSKDAEAFPEGPLSLHLYKRTGVLIVERTFHPISNGSTLAVSRTKLGDSISVFDKENGSRLDGEYASFLVMCKQGEPTASTCYTMSDMKISLESQLQMPQKDGNFWATQTAQNTLNLVYQLTGNQAFTGNSPNVSARLIDAQTKTSISQGIENERLAAEQRRLKQEAEEVERKKQKEAADIKAKNESNSPAFSIGEGWFPIGEYRGEKLFLMKSIIGRSETSILPSVLINNAKAVKVNGHLVQSSVTFYEIQCVTRQMARLNVSGYELPMGEGAKVYSDKVNIKWSSIEPGTPFDSLFTGLCSKRQNSANSTPTQDLPRTANNLPTAQRQKVCKTVTRYEHRPFNENVCDYNQYGPINCRNVTTRYEDVPIQSEECS